MILSLQIGNVAVGLRLGLLLSKVNTPTPSATSEAPSAVSDTPTLQRKPYPVGFTRNPTPTPEGES